MNLDAEWEKAVANHQRMKGSSFMHLDEAEFVDETAKEGKRSSKSLSLREGGIRVSSFCRFRMCGADFWDDRLIEKSR